MPKTLTDAALLMRLRTRQKVSLRFVTDPSELERLGYAGQLSYEELYQHAA